MKLYSFNYMYTIKDRCDVIQNIFNNRCFISKETKAIEVN